MSLPPYQCHNRKPFALSVRVQSSYVDFQTSRFPEMRSIPFRMAMDCQYTKSDLGQMDSRCHGCKWRQGVAAGGAAQAGTEST